MVDEAEMRAGTRLDQRAEAEAGTPVVEIDVAVAICALRQQSQPAAGAGAERPQAHRAEVDGILALEARILRADTAADRDVLQQSVGYRRPDLHRRQRRLIGVITADPVRVVLAALAERRVDAEAERQPLVDRQHAVEARQQERVVLGTTAADNRLA